MRTKTIVVVLIFVLCAISPYFASVSADDEAAAGPDAGDTAGQADVVYSVAEWFEGNVSAEDEADHYYHSYSSPDIVGIVVVAGAHDLYFGYDNDHTPPATMSYAITTVSAGMWEYIEPVTTSTTTQVYFYFTGVTTYDTGYCFGLIYSNSTAYGWDSLNESEACGSPQVAPSVTIVPDVDTGSDGSIDGGSIIEIPFVKAGYVSGFDVYWWDDDIGILSPLDHSEDSTQGTIAVEALNYNTEKASVIIYVCLSGVSEETVREVCLHTSTFGVNYISSSTTFDCTSFNGMGGAVFISGNLYMSGDIVEHPAGSNEFWLSMSDFLPDTPGPNTKWFGPCNCTQIGLGNMWDTANIPYPTFAIVQDSNTIWIALDVTMEEPFDDSTGAASNQWQPCATLTSGGGGDDVPCANGHGVMANDYNGLGGPVWNTGDPTIQDEIYEYPAYSGEFWIARHTISNPQEPGSAGWEEIWLGWCNCSEIWQGAGSPVWDSAVAYPDYTMINWPAGSTQIWIANSAGAPAGAMPGNSSNWNLCGNSGSNEGPCSQYNGLGGPVWLSTQNHPTGSIVEYPAGSNEFWISMTSIQAGGNPPSTGDMWNGVCNCTEIWNDAGSPNWNSNSVYTFGQILEDSGALYISTQYSNQNNPTTNTKWWRPCGGEEIDPCTEFSGFTGPFYNQNQQTYQSGDIVEFPAGSGDYYVNFIDNNQAHPTKGELRGWKLCSCSELSDGTTWQPFTQYPDYKIVEHNGILYVKKDTVFSWYPGDPEPGLNTGLSKYFWRLCAPGHCEPVVMWNQNDANNGMYDQGVAVWTYWMGGIVISYIDDNANNPSSQFFNNGWTLCIHKPPKKWYPEGVVTPVDPPVNYINRTYDRLLENPDGNRVLSIVDLQDGDSSNNFPANCWFDENGKISWSQECDDDQRANPATFEYRKPDVVTGHCDPIGLENSNAVLMNTLADNTQDEMDIGGHILVESSGIAGPPHQCGAILLLSADSFPTSEGGSSNSSQDDSLSKTSGRYYYTVYPHGIYDSWWACVWATILHDTRCYGPVGEMADGESGEGIQSTYEVLISDGEQTTRFYALNMVGKTCDMFDITDDVECYDKVVVDTDEMEDSNSENEVKDSDEDGVIDEWDDCANTEQGAATDSKGCKVETLKETIEDEESTPGFTFIFTISAMFCAVILTRKKIGKD